jgi:1-aminocyclopropane-1-carboxylate deaminase/D-cysteine desulfhydrase-like pyridoxal-dependent ACC family enzyme
VQHFPVPEKINISHWDDSVFSVQDLHVDVLRLDQIHPLVSGNKWFKLKYFIARAKKEGRSKLVSFGGAWSNHLLALAEASRMQGFSSAAYIRGEEPKPLSRTLQDARDRGMELNFLSRTDYERKKKSAIHDPSGNGERDALIIPEGGAGTEGVLGASEILHLIPTKSYSHICCAVGTGVTFAGLINGSGPRQKIIGVSVLKGTRGYAPLDPRWLSSQAIPDRVTMIHEDHFGGYAKTSGQLFEFMNRVFFESGIPSDFVYTGKLFYSIVRLSTENYFPAGSRILVLHSGGLQGNRSLPPGLLHF